MESHSLNVNYRMQRTATLAQEVLERAKTRKLNWPLPSRFQRRTFRNYYCCMAPFQFKECEIAHIFRYHSRQASEKLLKTFENEESKHGPIVEEPGCPDTESVALIPAKTSDPKASIN